jgi:hypothetical protein
VLDFGVIAELAELAAVDLAKSLEIEADLAFRTFAYGSISHHLKLQT